MVSDEVRDRLSDLVDGTGRTIDWAVEQYEEAYSDVEDRLMEDVPEERKREFAVGMVESEKLFQDRVGGGEEMDLQILAIGQRGRMEDWGQENRTVVYSHGIIRGPLGDDGETKAGKAVFLNVEETGMDLADVQRKFHALNTMKSVYEVSESQDLEDVYVCWSNGTTELVEQELEGLPDDRQEKIEILRRMIPEASLATLEEDLTSYDPESGYTRDFGADIRRIEGRVVDRYVPDDNSWARYTIMDDSVTEDDIVGTNIVDEDANIPGLTVWADPEHHMEFGRKSRCEFYGIIEEGENGNLEMNLAGIVPIIPMPVEERGESADEDVQSTEEEL